MDPFSGILGVKAAKHLLRRTTFGVSRKNIDDFANYTGPQALQILLNSIIPPQDSEIPWLVPNPFPDIPIDENLKIRQFKGWLLERMRLSGTSIIEKYVFFLHTHFTAIESVIAKHTALYNQNKLFRFYALGNIKTLTRKICTDNAMLILLDGTLNVNGSPNENFAREFLELFSIGKGPQVGEGDYSNYTEQDVREAARVLSGFVTDFTYAHPDIDTGIASGIVKTATVDSPSGTMAASKHDAGTKIFSTRFDLQQISPIAKEGRLATVDSAQNEVDQLVNMVFAKIETSKNICRKLYRFFVYYKISEEIERDIITPLANLLVDSNFEIKPVLQKLLASKHFFDTDNAVNTDDSRGAIIKSPIDLVIGTFVFFNAQANSVIPPDADKSYSGPYESVLKSLIDQGMDLYEPLDVSGYDAYSQAPYYNRNWISANFLANRYLFPFKLINGNKSIETFFGFHIDVMEFVNNTANITNPSVATMLLQELIDYLLPEAISEERFNYFKDSFLDGFSDTQWRAEWIEYNASGNDKQVRLMLENLIWTILKSPEYQLY